MVFSVCGPSRNAAGGPLPSPRRPLWCSECHAGRSGPVSPTWSCHGPKSGSKWRAAAAVRIRCSSSTMRPTSFPPRASPGTRKPHVRGPCDYSDRLLGPLDPGRRVIRQDDQDVLLVVAHVGLHETETDNLQERQKCQDAVDAVHKTLEQGLE